MENDKYRIGDIMPEIIDEILESENRRFEKINTYLDNEINELKRISKLPDDNEEKIAKKIEVREYIERVRKNCGE
ncbi:MAG: hypothetical protein LBM59_07805 [Ruminococcus sp.]|jgi:hypothetical protein|nr:hypothetical protein [Ruminococcus sp.]